MTPTANSTCTLRDPAKPETPKCWERSSAFRTDGLCGFHGKAKDGLCGHSPLGTRSGLRGGAAERQPSTRPARMKRRREYALLLDGAVHEISVEKDRQGLVNAARARRLSVRVWTDNGKTYVQSHPRPAVAS